MQTENKVLKRLCDNVDKYLPLKITFFKAEDYYLSFGGEDWNFYSDSDWRIIKNGDLLCSYDNFNEDKVREVLISNNVVEISSLTEDFLDPVLILSNFVKVEIFSVNNDEPWKIELPDIFYVPYGKF